MRTRETIIFQWFFIMIFHHWKPYYSVVSRFFDYYISFCILFVLVLSLLLCTSLEVLIFLHFTHFLPLKLICFLFCQRTRQGIRYFPEFICIKSYNLTDFSRQSQDKRHWTNENRAQKGRNSKNNTHTRTKSIRKKKYCWNQKKNKIRKREKLKLKLKQQKQNL